MQLDAELRGRYYRNARSAAEAAAAQSHGAAGGEEPSEYITTIEDVPKPKLGVSHNIISFQRYCILFYNIL